MNNWLEFYNTDHDLNLIIAPFDESVILSNEKVAIITEQQLFGEKPKQRNRNFNNKDPETIIKQLTDLTIGAPIVHVVYGIGRYRGLIKLNYSEDIEEFLHLEYADSDKLYVPVHALDLVSRYTGSSPELSLIHI